MVQHLLAIFIVTLVSASALYAKDDTCQCKNWMQAYKDIPCGSSNEYYFASSENLPSTRSREKYAKKWGEMLCTEFYEKLNTNKCVNINMGKDEGQWCYVDSACKNLNFGGRIPNSQFSWKSCKGGKDSTLRDLKPEELYQFSKEQNVWFAVLHKMSYPGERAGDDGASLWKDVKEAFGFSDEAGVWTQNLVHMDMPGDVALKMRKIHTLNTPYYFDTNGNGTVPHIIVNGRKTMLVEGDKIRGTNPGDWSTLRCIGGC